VILFVQLVESRNPRMKACMLGTILTLHWCCVRGLHIGVESQVIRDAWIKLQMLLRLGPKVKDSKDYRIFSKQFFERSVYG
jgi:hypothetical protein